MPEAHDTIAAIATPPGRGGIGILRLSGPDALAIAIPLLRLRTPLDPNSARFCEVLDPSAGDPTTAAKLDEAVVTYFQKPRSYTGEDVLEIAAHGSPVLLDFLLRQTITLGARLANPGEFTERAFLAGRLDLTQAEAVRDLIDAQTLYQARIAAQQLDGALSRRISPIKVSLIHLIAQLEAGIDFAEDDTPTLAPPDFLALVAPIAEQLGTLAHSFEHGRLVHAGFTLAIVGAPNVGKSSLFNRLVERERAIVTSTPGTTRDLVSERVSLAGIPIELVDTAGLRQATDEAERLGIEKSREALADADLVLVVLDAGALFQNTPNDQPNLSAERPETLPWDTICHDTIPDDIAVLLRSLDGPRIILVLNKSDLLSGHVTRVDALDESPTHSSEMAAPVVDGLEMDAAAEDASVVAPPSAVALSPIDNALAYLQQGLLQSSGHLPRSPIIATSARTGSGLDSLRQAIEQHLQTPGASEQSGMLTNLRQHQSVEAALSALKAAQLAAHLPHEMILLDLYSTLRHLDALTGETTSDDILNLIFSTFCIGK